MTKDNDDDGEADNDDDNYINVDVLQPALSKNNYARWPSC